MKRGQILRVLGESFRASAPQPLPSNLSLTWDAKILDALERTN